MRGPALPAEVRPGWQAWLGPLRPPFLLLTVSCVLLGAAFVHWTQGRLPAGGLALVMGGALLAHAAVNAFNEWFDFRNGLDLRTRRTPFSGGSGTLPRHPQLAPYALGLALASTLGCAAIGLLLLRERGMVLLPIGLLGLLLVLGYSPLLVRRPWLCLIAPGLGVGLLMVGGSVIALGGHYSLAVWLAALPPFFLANGLLLLNQFPDLEADRSVGRRNLAILHGRPTAARVYSLLLALAYGALLLAVLSHQLPMLSLLGLLTLPLALWTARRVLRSADDLPALLPAMAVNVLISLLTPLLIAAGLYLA